MARNRSFKKRYIPLVLCGLWLCLVHSGRLDLIRSNTDIKAEFEAEGLKPPIFDIIPHPHSDKQTHCIITDHHEAPILVIFLHGSPGSGSNCIGYLKDSALLAAAQVATIDRPGYGQSDKNQAQKTLEGQCDYIRAVMEKYGQGKKIILAGHSLGGPLIAKAAMLWPDDIHGLVFIAASNDPALEPREWYRPFLNWPIIKWCIPGPVWVSNQEIMPLKQELEKMLPHWGNIRGGVCVIQGDNDWLVPWENATFTAQKLKNARHLKVDLIKDADHFILWSEQNRITRHILDIISIIHKIDSDENTTD